MSEAIKHECGIALIRLLKPLDYYRKKYVTNLYGLNKLYLLMEKQHNRGQDGAGVASIKLSMPPGHKYISRERSNSNQPIKDIFEGIFSSIENVRKQNPALLNNDQWLKENIRFMGEVLMGHLRYGTHGVNTIETCHPFLRQNNWMSRSLVLAGNFNLTNVDELFNQLVELGQHPKEASDTVTVLEKIGHFLDDENQKIFDEFNNQKHSNRELSQIIAKRIDIQRILTRSVKDFDGGYTMVGMLGHGDAFVLRDPNGIRPAWFYQDDEVVVSASERPAIQTVFNIPSNKIREILPGHALVVKKNGKVSMDSCAPERPRTSCSFERIYFSRGTDEDVYRERKNLGKLLRPDILKAINYDIDNTVFSYIPNTAEVAFLGLIKELDCWLSNRKKTDLAELGDINNTPGINKILNQRIRIEKVAVKDVKLRTFITRDDSRNELVSHVYDITYGSVKYQQDNLVILDDSIVRGTTLQKSILSILDRLGPKQIIVVSSAPQIRYPDCYGIDMSKLGDFIAFRAAIELTKKQGNQNLLNEIYQNCKASEHLPVDEIKNEVKQLYEQFTDEEIAMIISEIVRPPHIFSNVRLIYQSIENLHKAIPDHTGDWYFSGNYPTPGGNRVVNRAFINYMEGKNERAY